MPSFDDTTWGFYEAVTEMFFADLWDSSHDLAFKKRVHDALRSVPKAGQNGIAASFPGNFEERIVRLKTQLPRDYELTSVIASPIFWVRFASSLKSIKGLRVTGKFFGNFGEWRTTTDTTNGQMRASLKTPQGQQEITLEQYLLDPNIAEPEKWEIKYSKPLIAKQKGPTKRKRTTEEIVGSRVYKAVRDCVEKAANKAVKIPGFSGKKVNGGSRYSFVGTREKLAKELQKKFPDDLPDSTNHIVQALSDFVGCGRYSSKKKGALNKK